MSMITADLDNGVLWLVLNRPEQANALDMDMARALRAAAEAASSDPEVRCVVLTGAGRMFCVGGDIGAFAAAGDQAGSFIRDLAAEVHEAVFAFANMAKPLVCLVNGPAAGAGLSLAVAGDIVLASDTATFSAAYTAIGLTPDGGMSWLLPRLIGLRATQDLMLTNRRVSGEETVRLGLATRVVPAASLAEEGRKLAAQLADGAVRAFGSVRQLLAGSHTATLETQLSLEAESIGKAAASAEGREGVAAFIARRKPDFRSV